MLSLFPAMTIGNDPQSDYYRLSAVFFGYIKCQVTSVIFEMALCFKTIILIDYEWLEKNAEQDERANAKSLLFDMEIFCERLWDFYYTFVKCSLLNGEQKKVSHINYSIPPPKLSLLRRIDATRNLHNSRDASCNTTIYNIGKNALRRVKNFQVF